MKFKKSFLHCSSGLIFLGLLSGCSLVPDVGLSRTSAAHTNGVILKDSRGSWNQVQLAETNDIFLEANQSVSRLRGVKTDLTDAELHSAANWVLKFVSSEGIDSIAADSTEGWAKWKSAEAPKYVDESCIKKVLATPRNYNTVFGLADRSQVIFNNINERFDGLFVRGEQRISQMGFDGPISSVATGFKKNSATVSGNLYATYRVDNRVYIKQILNEQPLMTEELLKATAPNLFNNKVGQGSLSWNFNFTVLKQKDGGWKICDTENYFLYEGKTN